MRGDPKYAAEREKLKKLSPGHDMAFKFRPDMDRAGRWEFYTRMAGTAHTTFGQGRYAMRMHKTGFTVTRLREANGREIIKQSRMHAGALRNAIAIGALALEILEGAHG